MSNIRAIHETSDHDLKLRVEAFLAARHFASLRSLQVRADSGVVTLRGRVHSFYEKQLAQHLSRRVAGVHSLVDEIEVDRPKISGAISPLRFSPGLSDYFALRRQGSNPSKRAG